MDRVAIVGVIVFVVGSMTIALPFGRCGSIARRLTSCFITSWRCIGGAATAVADAAVGAMALISTAAAPASCTLPISVCVTMELSELKLISKNVELRL